VRHMPGGSGKQRTAVPDKKPAPAPVKPKPVKK
jgi:hypothetical protein